MKTRHEEIPFTPPHPLTAELFTETSIFFDIETTGFSPKHTSLYLIGCARRNGSCLCLDQFFAESPTEEKAILNAFLELLHTCDTIITYNGAGFDVPYLKAKCSQYNLTENFTEFEIIDIFKSVSKLKHILNLENCKQKSIEKFLHLTRDDLCTGGELIPIYQTYTKSLDESLLKLLLLHNYEDVLGMTDLLPMLSYAHLFEGNFCEIKEIRLDSAKTYDNSFVKELTLTITPKYPLPEPITFRLDELYLSGRPDMLSLVIRLYEGDLKYFYPNYKDYYYLPDEDAAIHKSVAAYVDREHRIQAKASTCYTKKSGLFLPQYSNNFMTPAFYKNYGEKISYFMYTESFASDYTILNKYAKHILTILFEGKSYR